MQGSISVILSLVAVGLSVMTTYLSFFDERYAVTLSVAKHSIEKLISSSRSGRDTPLEIHYQVHVKPTFILSNRGTRPLVLTDIKAILSADMKECKDGDLKRNPVKDSGWSLSGSVDPVIIEPGVVRQLQYNFNIGNNLAQTLKGEVKNLSELWCLKFTLFDHRGKRLEPIVPYAKFNYHLHENERSRNGDGAPDLKVDAPYTRHPLTLASSSGSLGF